MTSEPSKSFSKPKYDPDKPFDVNVPRMAEKQFARAARVERGSGGWKDEAYQQRVQKEVLTDEGEVLHMLERDEQLAVQKAEAERQEKVAMLQFLTSQKTAKADAIVLGAVGKREKTKSILGEDVEADVKPMQKKKRDAEAFVVAAAVVPVANDEKKKPDAAAAAVVDASAPKKSKGLSMLGGYK
jgi:hypothetical protein